MILCIDRPGEWMVSEDKKGAVLAYEQEHDLIPDVNNSIDMLVNPNTQELHESLQSRSSNYNAIDINYSILSEMSQQERTELESTAILCSHCYLTLIFSGIFKLSTRPTADTVISRYSFDGIIRSTITSVLP